MSIEVDGLFRCHSHKIELSDEGLTFIHSLNGVGKSTALRIVTDLFSRRFTQLKEIPFDAVSVTFDDGTSVRASNKDIIDAVVTRNGTEVSISEE